MTEPKIKLFDIYIGPGPGTLSFLYGLLAQSDASQNISHQTMPTWDEHVAFVKSRPYSVWFLITTPPPVECVGSIYITKTREVGIRIERDHIGKGYGGAALATLREFYPGPLLANINPANERSIAFFKKHGARLIQHTYAL